jgi:hypothetical protein
MLSFFLLQFFAARVMKLYMNVSVEICLDLLCIIDSQTANGLHMVSSLRLVLEIEVVYFFLSSCHFHKLKSLSE